MTFVVCRKRDSKGAFHLPKTLRNFHGEVHRVKNVFYLTQIPFFHALVTKIQDGDTDITVNSLELVIPCEKKNGTSISTGKFQTGKQDYLFKIPLILGNFSVERTENVCSIPTGIYGISW